MSNQVDMATQLLEEIEVVGLDELNIFTLLDSLAAAGLKLSKDKKGQVSNAWADFIREHSDE